MADILRIKRRISGSPGAPTSLANAEIAYNEVDHTLYYGEGTGGAGGTATVVVPIGGSGASSGVLPLINGTAAPGTATLWSRGDHVHPVDTSRYAATNPSGYQTAAQVLAVRLDQFAAPNTDVSWASHKIINLLDPTNPQDATTKNYVDLAIQGLETKQPCLVATTGVNLTLSGTQTIDGVAVIAGNRVLVKDQTIPANNGIYVVAAAAWARAADADQWAEFPGAYVFIESGTANSSSGWTCTAVAGGTLGTTAITWVQFSGAGQIIAGNGLTKSGNTLSVVGTANRITVGASVDIASTYVGQTSITTVGTLTVGALSGLAISGGTIDGVTFDMGTF